MKNQHIASTVFMVAPSSFGFDQQTAVSNSFQHQMGLTAAEITGKAQAEFDQFVAKLQQYDIDVIMFRDQATPPKPNAVFPNNWFTTWPDGRVFLYPMATPSRRIERSPAALDVIRKTHKITEVIDLSPSEEQGKFLEGTGVLVFDHASKYVYSCPGPRCDEALLNNHARSLGYTSVIFRARDSTGAPMYHTNMTISIQSTTAVICSEAIADPSERRRVVETLEKSGHTVVDITQKQLDKFCGNVLEVQNNAGQTFLVLSKTAYDAFTPEQRELLSQDKTLLPIDIPTIERVGGGSARCMLAEIFLPKASLTSI